MYSEYTGRYKSQTGSTRTASPGRINSDRLGSSQIMKKKKNIKLNEVETFTHLKVKIPVKTQKWAKLRKTRDISPCRAV